MVNSRGLFIATNLMRATAIIMAKFKGGKLRNDRKP